MLASCRPAACLRCTRAGIVGASMLHGQHGAAAAVARVRLTTVGAGSAGGRLLLPLLPLSHLGRRVNLRLLLHLLLVPRAGDWRLRKVRLV
jgi:hypothetical protein